MKNLILIILSILAIVLGIIAGVSIKNYLDTRSYFGNNLFDKQTWLAPSNENVIEVTKTITYTGHIESYEVLSDSIRLKFIDNEKKLSDYEFIEIPNKILKGINNYSFIDQSDNVNTQALVNDLDIKILDNANIVISVSKVNNNGNISTYINGITFTK